VKWRGTTLENKIVNSWTVYDFLSSKLMDGWVKDKVSPAINPLSACLHACMQPLVWCILFLCSFCQTRIKKERMLLLF